MPAGWKRQLRDAFREAALTRKEKDDRMRDWPAVLQAAPVGDGHPVLVLPGFSADDNRIMPLCNAMRAKGYAAETWGLGRNFGLHHKTVKRLRAKLEKMYADNGNRKVTLVGHSLGGIFARELAREFPHLVRGVITLGSAFGAMTGEQHAMLPGVMGLVALLNGRRVPMREADIGQRFLTPPPMPATSIFSRSDSVASWSACLNPAAPQAENVEVPGVGHMGLAYNADMLAVVLDRLAQPEGGWQPYAVPSRAAPPQNPNWDNPAGRKIFKKP